MRKVFKINNVIISNFYELQNHFVPLSIYQQLPDFIRFAKIHCLPLSSMIEDAKTHEKYYANYINKEFFLEVLKLPALTMNNAHDYLQSLLDNYIKQNEYDRDECLKEVNDLRLYDKLICIMDHVNIDDDYQKAVILLSICELSEIDILSHKDIWNISNSMYDISNLNYQHIDGMLIANIPMQMKPYKFWYCDSYNPHYPIETVKIIAREGKYANQLKIELYSEKTLTCVKKIVLQQDEYIYCHVSNGKIIQFLSVISKNKDQCVYYNHKTSSIEVYNSQDNISTLTKAITASDVSVLSTGTSEQGFLFIQKGNLVYNNYYQLDNTLPIELVNYNQKNPPVDVLIKDEGYMILLSDGSIVSNIDEYKQLNGLLSLHDYSQNNMSEAKEIIQLNDSYAILFADGHVEALS